MEVREVGEQDIAFLREMFLQAFWWRGDRPHTWAEALGTPALATYVADWGRTGDFAVVAISEAGERLGAAWYRTFSETEHAYGFVSADIPELGIAVSSDHRGRGVGRRLMEGLIRFARDDGRPGLSLSVDANNSRALHLYETLGFERIERIGLAWTMLLRLMPG